MKFVIVCSSRTGSTMLNSAFNNHPKISSFDEAMTARGIREDNLYPERQGIKDPYIKIQRRWRWEHCLWYWMKHINKWNVPFNADHLITPDILFAYFDWLFSRDENVCFKLLHPHVEIFPFSVTVLKGFEVKVIHLTREPAGRVASMRAKFNPKESDEELLRITEKEYQDIAMWFPERLEVSYEEITGDKEIKQIPPAVVQRMFDYLELPYEPKLYPQTMKVRREK